MLDICFRLVGNFDIAIIQEFQLQGLKRWSFGQVALRSMIYSQLSVCHRLLTLMLLANLSKYKMKQKNVKMTETLAHGYSSESTHREPPNEYQHDRV